jgi:hypothetical protein
MFTLIVQSSDGTEIFSSSGSVASSPCVPTSRSIRGRIADWLKTGEAPPGTFEEVALDLARVQIHDNPAYGNYCRARGVQAEHLQHWREIPAVPTDAFKFRQHRLATFSASETVARFLTSGTTREVRGVHEFDDLEFYHASIRGAWCQLELPPIRNPWFVAQHPTMVPESSLTHMFGVLAAGAKLRHADSTERWLIDATGAADPAPLVGMASGGVAVELFGTAIALLRFAETFGVLPLPVGSWIFETGGYKGLADAPDPDGIREKLAAGFGVPSDCILNEYSMTEISSQFYRWPHEPAHRGPAWTRIRVIDPETGCEVAHGSPGYLEIIDLANVGSVCAIRTQDLAISRGDTSFILLGRDPGALPRGCSRASDELWHRS